MNGEQKIILIAAILGAAAAFAFPQFMFGAILGLASGIAIEARFRWFVNKNTLPSQKESTQLESVTITEKRVPIFHKVCHYCGTKIISATDFTKCPSCGANL